LKKKKDVGIDSVEEKQYYIFLGVEDPFGFELVSMFE